MNTHTTFLENDFLISHTDDLTFSDIQVFTLGYERTIPNKPVMDTSSLIHFSLHFVLSGVGYYEINNKQYKVTRNCLFVLYPNIDIKYYPDKKNPWTYAWINFNGKKVLPLLQQANLSPETPILSLPNSKIGKILLNSLSTVQNEKQHKELSYLFTFYNVLHEIAQAVPYTNITPKKKEDIVSKTLDFLNTNYSDPNLTLKTLSDYLHVNPSYLSRIIKQKTGTSCIDFLTSLRVSNAIKLMETGEQYVNDIGRRVGFMDPYYFSKVFKKYAHISPKDYIRQLESKKSVTPQLNSD